MLRHPVPNSHLQSIGDITVSFAMLESQIQFLVGLLIKDPGISQIITAELSFRNLRALVVSIFINQHGIESEYYNTLKDLMVRSGKIEERRNQITHSIWGAGRNPDTITRIKTTAKEKHGLRFHFEDVKADDLSDFATEIKILAEEILRFAISLEV